MLNTPEDLQNAFAEWNEKIYSFFYLRVNQKVDAGDLTQEVFMRAWKYRESFSSEKSELKNWLYAIARNVLNKYLGQLKKYQADELTEVVPSDQDLAAEISEFELIDYVFRKLSDLPEKERRLLNLRYREGYSVREIAEVLEMEYSATKVAIHRAVKKLQVLCRED